MAGQCQHTQAMCLRGALSLARREKTGEGRRLHQRTEHELRTHTHTEHELKQDTHSVSPSVSKSHKSRDGTKHYATPIFTNLLTLKLGPWALSPAHFPRACAPPAIL